MGKYRVAIIGAGHIAESHYRGFALHGADVVAVVNHNVEKAKAFAAERNIEGAYSSWEDLIASGADFDIVSICTPNSTHREIAIKALRAGKHVYSEKPPALNAKETFEMVKEAENSDKLLVFAFNNRARRGALELKRKIDAFELGDVNSVQAEWIRRKGIPGFGGWFTNKELSGGGPVIDLVHMLDLALYMMGYPEAEYVLASNFKTFIDNLEFSRSGAIGNLPVNVEAASHAMITFKDGRNIFSRASWAEMIEDENCSITLQGTKAGAKLSRAISNKKKDILEWYDKENTSEIFDSDGEMGRLDLIGRFLRVLDGEDLPLPNPKEALTLMKIIDAIYESADRNAPIKVDELFGI